MPATGAAPSIVPPRQSQPRHASSAPTILTRPDSYRLSRSSRSSRQTTVCGLTNACTFSIGYAQLARIVTLTL